VPAQVHESAQPQSVETAGSSSPAAVAVTTKKPRLAIMPFENLSPDPNNAFFTDGLHEEILTALANSAPGLEVISRTTMMSFRGRPVTVQEVAKELGATHVLEGSVRRDGQDVRLTLQLIDARNDDHLWAQNYDRKLIKAMTLQSAVAAEVATQLSAKLTGAAQSAGAPTTNPEAYDLYLKARLEMQLLNPSVPLERWRTVESLLTRAIERDPSFALAYAARSDLRVGLFTQNFDAEDVLTSARADLDTAERLRPSDPAWLIAEAQWAVLDEHYARALELVTAAEAAGVAEATTVTAKAQIKSATNQFTEGFALMQRAAALDPQNAGLGGGVAIFLAALRKPAEAIQAFKALAQRVPGFAPQLQGTVDYIRYGFTGDRQALAHARLAASPLTFGPQAGDDFALLRTQAAALPARGPRLRGDITAPEAVGPLPQRAHLLGQLDFLLGDRAATARDGRDILDFIASEKPTRRNQWLLKVLASEAAMYMGDKAGALTAAHEALSLTPRSLNVANWVTARAFVAEPLAWAGAQDESVAGLEATATSIPGLMPALIARDPILAVVLSGNVRYHALVARLEAQMAATKLD
jgi:TolB-like protein